MQNILINELKDVLENYINEPCIVVFYAKWCSYCKINLPFIKKNVLDNNIKNVYFVDIGGDDVKHFDLFDKDLVWNLEVVPTTRIYMNNKIIFDNPNVLDQEKINKLVKVYLEYNGTKD